MSIVVTEVFESRPDKLGDVGETSSTQLKYIVQGSEDDLAILAALQGEGGAPSSWMGCPRRNIELDHAGDCIWRATVNYATSQGQDQSNQFNFDTGGGTEHILNSLATSQKKAAAGNAPDLKGAINNDGKAINGVDVTVLKFMFSETWWKADTSVDQSYKLACAALTGKTNAGEFRGMPVGSVLFMGASGTRHGSGKWEITYRFAYSPNKSNITVGGIPGINKLGWEYLWILYEDQKDDDAKMLVRKPKAVYIERVYYSGDFDTLELSEV